jgi:cytochrome c-type protein NapC
MLSPTTLTALVFIVTIALVALLFARPSLTARREGKILAFLALFLLPVLCSAVGFSNHMERTKTTQFCLSCHVMEPYGQSLYLDDAHFIPASHFQNHRVPADEACYTCHTDYALYGGIRAKMRGLHHVYVQYLGKPPAPADIKLYTPFNNRECLHCHQGARSFEESPTHTALHDDIVSNQMSCLTGGCHDTVHNIAGLSNAKFWKPAP